jgi:hypothetical protein
MFVITKQKTAETTKHYLWFVIMSQTMFVIMPQTMFVISKYAVVPC